MGVTMFGVVKILFLHQLIILLSCSSNWKYGAEQFVKRLPDKVFVHCSERNMATLTLDGVDIIGLMARYVIGKLYKPPKEEVKDDISGNGCKEEPRATIGGLEAINFITVATPHLGSRGNKQIWFMTLCLLLCFVDCILCFADCKTKHIDYGILCVLYGILSLTSVGPTGGWVCRHMLQIPDSLCEQHRAATSQLITCVSRPVDNSRASLDML
ncbi:DUF676 domain-containing protein [Gossypium australe]|uniref:DUF676 domain-containing protein n=1 Tax=Gossypium australe TaxID=47621 RepID=A0A5B6VUZ0_9ROSI|nr:DUF676 domain-containing protein [Gossypium australe]